MKGAAMKLCKKHNYKVEYVQIVACLKCTKCGHIKDIPNSWKKKPRKPKDLYVPDGHIEVYGDEVFLSIGMCESGDTYFSLKVAKQLHNWLGRYIDWAGRKEK